MDIGIFTGFEADKKSLVEVLQENLVQFASFQP